MDKKGGGKLFLISVAVLAASFAAAMGLSALTGGVSADPGASDLGDPPYASVAEIYTGRIPGAGDAPSGGSEKEFYYIINTTVTFDAPTAVGNLMLENTVGNNCSIQMVVTLDDGRTVYTSPTLLPNTYITADRLTDPPEAGTYTASAVVTAYDLDSGEQIGNKVSTLSITVK